MSVVNNINCFANRGITRCSVLTNKQCDGCKFFKTVEKYKEDRLKHKTKEIEYLTRHGLTYKE